MDPQIQPLGAGWRDAAQPKVGGQPRQRSDLLLDRRRQLGKLARPGHKGIPPAPEHICFFLKVLAGLIKDITSPPKLCHP